MITKKTYKDYVSEYIYAELQEGKLQPGDQVLESRLANQLGISRAPIREALQQLVGDGLLEYKAQVGTFVAVLTAKEIMDAYLTRGLLEGYAVADGMSRLSESDLQYLEGLCRQMETCAHASQHRELIVVGREFHAFLFSKSENRQLINYTERLSSKLHLLFYKHWASLYNAEEIRDRHRSLLDTIRTGDTAAVESAIRQHYAETGAKVAEFYQQQQRKGQDDQRSA